MSLDCNEIGAPVAFCRRKPRHEPTATGSFVSRNTHLPTAEVRLVGAGRGCAAARRLAGSASRARLCRGRSASRGGETAVHNCAHRTSPDEQRVTLPEADTPPPAIARIVVSGCRRSPSRVHPRRRLRRGVTAAKDGGCCRTHTKPPPEGPQCCEHSRRACTKFLEHFPVKTRQIDTIREQLCCKDSAGEFTAAATLNRIASIGDSA